MKLIVKQQNSMEPEYSKRELDEHFRRMNERFDAQDKKLVSIDEQTKKTNGNVGSLKAWRFGITMCLGLIAFLVLPLIIYSFRLSQENLKNTILLELRNEHITEASP